MMASEITRGNYLPGEYVLRVIISQIYFGRPAYWNADSLSVIRFQKIRHYHRN